MTIGGSVSLNSLRGKRVMRCCRDALTSRGPSLFVESSPFSCAPKLFSVPIFRLFTVNVLEISALFLFIAEM
uniref:Uncharacterized protein n=1 Tax=Anguilla anguilla TaxID=7936 RepID=A0A0E9XN46_ANGAN